MEPAATGQRHSGIPPANGLFERYRIAQALVESSRQERQLRQQLDTYRRAAMLVRNLDHYYRQLILACGQTWEAETLERHLQNWDYHWQQLDRLYTIDPALAVELAPLEIDRLADLREWLAAIRPEGPAPQLPVSLRLRTGEEAPQP